MEWNELLPALLELNGQEVQASVRQHGAASEAVMGASGRLAVSYWGSSGSKAEHLGVAIGEDARVTIERSSLLEATRTECGVSVTLSTLSIVFTDLSRTPF